MDPGRQVGQRPVREYRGLWIALLILALLTPAGLYFPELLKSGTTWGEWGIEEIRNMIGYVPAGMEREAGRWKAPMPDYAPPGQGNASMPRSGTYYVLSAFAGIAACGGAGYLLVWTIRRKKR